ncbi:MAG: sigma-70 family RNA polymerase sigma factor [Blastocatellia bacterium]|nr:sigma-70 family RNA polymerase sigma factor [Blastocatellia bacterium]
MNQGEVTQLLVNWRKTKDAEAFNQLIPLVYTELHRIARILSQRHRDAQDGDPTLGPTAIVHQAYLNLIEEHNVEWKDRAHFLAIAAREMRRILVDHWRYKTAEMRGGYREQVSFSKVPGFVQDLDLDILELNDVLEQFREFDEEEARIIDLRFFGGMTVDEVAEVMELSRATVERRERHAKAWIRKRLTP